jgi:hypothetical protein
MSIIKLKSEFHKLIGSIENEARLQDLYDSVTFYLGQDLTFVIENSHAFKISWTDNPKENINDITNYLFKEWTFEVAGEFTNNLIDQA